MDRAQSEHLTRFGALLDTCSEAWKISHLRSPAFPRWRLEGLCEKPVVRSSWVRGTRTGLGDAGDKHDEKSLHRHQVCREGGTRSV